MSAHTQQLERLYAYRVAGHWTIISILVGAVVINIEFRNVGKIMRDNALRLGLQMELAADQAVYSRQQFGVRFHPESYEFYILSQTEKGDPLWEIFEDSQLRFQNGDVVTDYEVDISGLPIVLAELSEEVADATATAQTVPIRTQ